MIKLTNGFQMGYAEARISLDESLSSTDITPCLWETYSPSCETMTPHNGFNRANSSSSSSSVSRNLSDLIAYNVKGERK